MKALGLIFGHTVYAVTVVLATFMAGLAAGSAYFGHVADEHRDSIALYVRLEFLAGLTGSLSLLGLTVAHTLYLGSASFLANSRPLLIAIRVAGAIVVLIIPTFMMGGTFPILLSAIFQGTREQQTRQPRPSPLSSSFAWRRTWRLVRSEDSSHLAGSISLLYWTNTAGGVLGAVLAGFFLLPLLGLRLTIVVAVALNLSAALLARSVGQIDGSRYSRVAATQPKLTLREQSRKYLLLVLFGLVGCSAFAYEIAWTRMLAITIGSSTYAFTLIVAALLLGIAIGGILFQWYVIRSGPISLTTLAWTQAFIGAAALSSLLIFHWVPAWIPFLLRATNKTFAGLLATQFVAAGLTTLPTAILFGFNFPLVVELIRRESSQSFTFRAVGTSYAANTIGAIGGCVITGFWLIPWLGSFRIIASMAFLNLLLALAMHLSLSPRPFLSIAIDSALLAGALFTGRSPLAADRSVGTLSAVLYGNSYQGRLTLKEIAATKDLVYEADGANSSVAVVRTDGDVALRVNGKVDASTQDEPTQLLLGHLGLAFHPSPRRVLVIGFGSGMTASAVARYWDVEKIDVVEIEPAVIGAAPYLAALNRGVLKDPRLHVSFDDARDFLLTSREQYDVIISEPSNPWISGVATLFTDEYYAAAKERLRPGGIFVQWVQAYSLAPVNLRMIAGTFARHFPEVTLWRGGEMDLLLLGRTVKSPLSFTRLRSLWKNLSLRDDYTSLKIKEPDGLVAYFLLDAVEVRQLSTGSPLNTDDRTVLEYEAPRALLASEMTDAVGSLIGQYRKSPLPAALPMAERPDALRSGLNTALDLEDGSNAQTFLNALDPRTEDQSLDIARGRIALLQKDILAAKTLLQNAATLNPESPEAAYWFASAQQVGGDYSAALSEIERSLALHPNSLPALEKQMELAAAQGDFPKALSAQLKRMAFMPDRPAFEYGRLGALWLKMQDVSKAESALLKGLEKDPYCYACHFELGDVYVRTNKLRLARQQFEWVIRFFPDSDPAAFTSLILIDRFLKDEQAARNVLEEGLRLFPGDPTLLKGF